ncbi:MAG TPA: PAS domain S-box protein [Planktothrix sp.]|jgi:hypothetical protein
MHNPKEHSSKSLASQLAQSEEIFAMLVASVTDYAIFVIDPEGFVLTWNEGAHRIKGYAADEIIGQHFSIFYPQEARDISHPQYELAVARKVGRYEEEGWRIRKGGSKFWAHVVITAMNDSEGNLVGFSKVTRDLTERKLHEMEKDDYLKQQEVFRMLVSSVKDYAIFMLDPDGYVATWNEGAQRIKGYSADEIIGKHFSRFYTQEAKDRNHPQYELDVAKKEGRYEEEGWRIRKDGSTFWASVVITAVLSQGNLIGFAKVTRDLTERKKSEQQREATARLLAESNEELQRALEVKSRFLSTISHEVRTPMTGIIGMTELLTMEDLGADNNAVVRSIFDSSKRLLQLLNDVLDTTRMQSGKLTLEYRPFSVRAVIGDARQLISPEAMKKNLEVVGSCDENLPDTLCGDEHRLRQILLNLAFNAVKFTSSGQVDISCAVKSHIEQTTVLRFAVGDTGIGIKSDDRRKLFTPFSQAEASTTRIYGGTGLGLSICKDLVELMDGRIGVDSEFGKGSTFWFEVPFNSEHCG